jgi:hypothetical protein
LGVHAQGYYLGYPSALPVVQPGRSAHEFQMNVGQKTDCLRADTQAA